MQRLCYQLIPIALVWGFIGCAARPPVAANPFEIDVREYDRMYTAAIAVLRDSGFRVDRRDYRFGRITSLPLASPTIFEPWVGHNSTSQLAQASTISSMRRVVTVRFDPSGPNDDAVTDAYGLKVEVKLQRAVRPLHRVYGTFRQNIISSLGDVPYEWHEQGITGQYWEELGRDEQLEQRLLRKIVYRAMKLPSP